MSLGQVARILHWALGALPFALHNVVHGNTHHNNYFYLCLPSSIGLAGWLADCVCIVYPGQSRITAVARTRSIRTMVEGGGGGSSPAQEPENITGLCRGGQSFWKEGGRGMDSGGEGGKGDNPKYSYMRAYIHSMCKVSKAAGLEHDPLIINHPQWWCLGGRDEVRCGRTNDFRNPPSPPPPYSCPETREPFVRWSSPK